MIRVKINGYTLFNKIMYMWPFRVFSRPQQSVSQIGASMENKCLCNCKCNKMWQTLKVYDHIKKIDEYLKKLESDINEMHQYPDAPWYSYRPFDNSRHHTEIILDNINAIRDKYAKDLGMNDG